MSLDPPNPAPRGNGAAPDPPSPALRDNGTAPDPPTQPHEGMGQPQTPTDTAIPLPFGIGSAPGRAGAWHGWSCRGEGVQPPALSRGGGLTPFPHRCGGQGRRLGAAGAGSRSASLVIAGDKAGMSRGVNAGTPSPRVAGMEQGTAGCFWPAVPSEPHCPPLCPTQVPVSHSPTPMSATARPSGTRGRRRSGCA